MAVILIILKLVVTFFVTKAVSQDVDVDSIPLLPNAQYQCVMWGECFVDPNTGFTQNCPYNGTARRMSPAEAPDIVFDILHRRCPHLFIDENGEEIELENFYTCCDTAQVISIESSLGLAEGIIGRCPSCFNNMVRHICDFTCSNEQSRFSSVNTATQGSLEYVTELIVNLGIDYMEDTYDSCKGVNVAQTSSPAMDLLCGSHGSANCNPYLWFDFMGNPDENFMAPFRITFIPSDNNEQALNPPTVPCSEAYNNSFPCSCMDCAESCPSGTAPVPPEPACDVFGVNCVSFSVAVTVFTLMCIFFIVLTVYEYIYDRRMSSIKDNLVNESNQESDYTRKIVITRMNTIFEKFFQVTGSFSAKNPILVLMLTSWVVAAVLYGLIFLRFTGNPIELWSPPDAETRQELDYFNSRFGPFYRTSQVFFQAKNLANIVHNTSQGEIEFGPAFNRDLLKEVANLEARIKEIGQDSNTGLEHVCFAPMRTPDDEPRLAQCAVMSFMVYFANDIDRLDESFTDENGYEINYLNTLQTCVGNSFGFDCMAEWGGNAEPSLVFGGFNGENVFEADTVVLTLPLANSLNEENIEAVMDWERRFLDLLKNYEENEKPDFIDLSFSAERSIEDELESTALTEAVTVAISYFLMFVYVTLSLGKISSIKTLCVESKFTLAISGIILVIVSIFCALGFFGYIGIPSTLLAVNVIPFFVLSVGVDNVFIMVNTLEESKLLLKTELSSTTLSDHKKIGLLFSDMLGKVGPSILLTSSSQIVCFAIGSLSKMPAVMTFALFAAMALVFLFIFQITTFVAILSLDFKRSKNNLVDILCCIRHEKIESNNNSFAEKQLTQRLVEFVTPYLLKWQVKVIVAIIFTAWVSASIVFIPNLELGLDQEMALTFDSYVRKYLISVNTLLQNGPPVFFVLTGGLNFSNTEHQNLVCGGQLCNADSLVTQVFLASQHSEITYLAKPSNSWIDDYFDWLNSDTCCKIRLSDNGFCPNDDNSGECTSCETNFDSFGIRPLEDTFENFVPFFLRDNPSVHCSNGGRASYSSSVNYILNDNGDALVADTNFMAYHTPLATSKDYYEALRYAKEISTNLTEMLREKTGLNDVRVFPYSIFYVYFEQYLTMWNEAVLALIYSLLCVLGVSLIFSGFNLFASFVIFIVVLMILVNMMGLMYFWNIPLNAVSLVNLIISIGMGVEFCSHTVYAYSKSNAPLREKTLDAMSSVGNNLISGITLTNIPIVVLAFASTELFEVFFFRMFFGVVVIGFLHGLIFLPVFLSFLSNLPGRRC